MLYSIFWFANEVIEILIYVLIAAAIFSWLEAFGVLDSRNRTVYMIGDFLDRVTTPVVAPVRRFIPPLGGIDISFIIVFDSNPTSCAARSLLRTYTVLAGSSPTRMTVKPGRYGSACTVSATFVRSLAATALPSMICAPRCMEPSENRT